LNTYFPRLTTESALWTWTAGGGSYYYSSGIGTSDDYALNDINVVFSLTLGSYFGDWNNESNWTKAALGSGKVLVSIYSGIPRSFFHPMALGGTIGESFLLTENNNFRDGYLPDTQGTHEVHQALLGDPTLRMWPRAAVGSLNAQGGSGEATITWSGGGAGYVGAHIYRSTSPDGPFTRITSNLATSGRFADSPAPGTYSYLVRPVYLESNGSGSFYDLGQGVIASNVTVTQGQTTVNPPRLVAQRTGSSTVQITVTADAGRAVVVEQSDDLQNWGQAATGTSSGAPMQFNLPIDGSLRRLFRARY
jgi:hypothetical protein